VARIQPLSNNFGTHNVSYIQDALVIDIIVRTALLNTLALSIAMKSINALCNAKNKSHQIENDLLNFKCARNFLFVLILTEQL
jgi:hypothetical protein